MATEVQTFDCTIPAGTPSTAPVTIPILFAPRVVQAVRIIVPPGPAGTVGFALSASGVNIIPINSGAWIITDDDKIDLPLENYLDSGSWALTGYNTGVYAHTIHVMFLLNLVTDTATAPTIISSDALSSS